MKKTNVKKVMAATVAGLVLVSGAAADDFGNDDFSFNDFGSDTEAASAVEVSGQVSSDVRGYVADEGLDKAGDVALEAGVDADISVKYSGAMADAEVKFNLNDSTLLEHPEDIIDEAYITSYMGNFKLEAGKMKNVWGKGDKLHVIDNFNADDYSDFIIPDYIDRRIATPMVKGTYAFDWSGKALSNLKIEGVYTPFLPVDRFATSGRWTPAQVNGLVNKVSDEATARVAASFEDYTKYSVTYGALTTLNANKLAAESALSQANKTLSDVNAVYSGVYQQIYQGAVALGFTPELAAAYAKTQVETKYVDYMKTLNAEYNSTYTADLAKAGDAIAAITFDYQEALGVYAKALEEAGCTSLDEAKEKLTNAGTEYMVALSMANALIADPGMIYPELNTLKYSQAGARITGSLGCFDWGLSYYNGYNKQPTVDEEKIPAYVQKYLSGDEITESDKFLTYDKKQTFGVEAATILWHFNLRGEACYNLSKTDSVQWLGGFDIDLPFWNMNVNVQETGTCILNDDKDTNNKLVANLTTSFANEKVAPEVTVMYGIEKGDLVVLPKLTVKASSEVSLYATGMYIWTKDENSEFAAWKDNSFVQIGAKIAF